LIDSFITIAAKARAEIKIEKSRFIGSAIPVSSREDAEEQYAEVRREFYDATHNCFAYRIGIESQTEFRYSDDGEPSGTAGRPIYDTIDSHSLTNVLVVVTRYFGGIKLGTGGLMRAYKEASDGVLRAATRVEQLIKQRFLIRHDHEHTAVVMRLLSEFDLKPLDTRYGESVELEAEIRCGDYKRFAAELVNRSHDRVEINPIGEPV